MLSEENPFVAAFICSKLNSVKLGHVCFSPLPPLSTLNYNIKKHDIVFPKQRKRNRGEKRVPKSEDSRTVALRWDWNQQIENLEQRAPIFFSFSSQIDQKNGGINDLLNDHTPYIGAKIPNSDRCEPKVLVFFFFCPLLCAFFSLTQLFPSLCNKNATFYDLQFRVNSN